MPAKKYRVKLSKQDRKALTKLTTSGQTSARKMNRARVLLLSDESQGQGSKTDQQIIDLLEISPATVVRIRQRYVEGDLETALNEKTRPGRPKEITSKQKATIIALACSDAPEGYAKWSLRLLADKLVELELLESISHNAVGQILKKANLSLISKDNGVSEN